MSKLFGPDVPVEMIVLWIIESAACFLLLYLLMAMGSVPDLEYFSFDQRRADPAALLAATIGLTSLAIGLYSPELCFRSRNLVVCVVLGAVLGFPAILVVSSIFGSGAGHHGIGQLAWKVTLAWLLCLCFTRLAFFLAMRLKPYARNVLVVSSVPVRDDKLDRSETRGGMFDIRELVVDGSHPIPFEQLRNAWGLVLRSSVRGRLSVDQLIAYKYRGIRVFSDSEFCERHLHRMELSSLPRDWLAFDDFRCSRAQNLAKRLSDIIISFAVVALTLPLMLLTALLIVLDSPGPMFFRQERVGLHGRTFMLLKFRSMATDAEFGRGPVWAAKNDPRVTRVGRFIRRTRIDELPQLVNVLRGDMSFVGPRPERPHFVDQLNQLLPAYNDRSYVKPGITGWAQVNYSYGASFEDARMKLSYDLYYVKHRSLLLDFRILLATVQVILFGEGAR